MSKLPQLSPDSNPGLSVTASWADCPLCHLVGSFQTVLGQPGSWWWFSVSLSPVGGEVTALGIHRRETCPSFQKVPHAGPRQAPQALGSFSDLLGVGGGIGQGKSTDLGVGQPSGSKPRHLEAMTAGGSPSAPGAHFLSWKGEAQGRGYDNSSFCRVFPVAMRFLYLPHKCSFVFGCRDSSRPPERGCAGQGRPCS